MSYLSMVDFLQQKKGLSREKKRDVLIDRVCKIYDTNLKELKGRRRVRNIVEARHVVFYGMHKKFGFTQQTSADFFNKDHATVIHSCKFVSNMIETDKDFNVLIKELL